MKPKHSSAEWAVLHKRPSLCIHPVLVSPLSLLQVALLVAFLTPACLRQKQKKNKRKKSPPVFPEEEEYCENQALGAEGGKILLHHVNRIG